MAKRVNAKKEKAKRNKINARKFRKSSNSRYGGKRRNYGRNDKKEDEETKEKTDDSSSSSGATDSQ